MAESDLLTRVARLYYEHDLTQGEIGTLLGLPRVRVTRLLADARRSGIVTIHVEGPTSPFRSEELGLEEAYGLRGCWVAATSQTESKTSASIARTGAAALTEALVGASAIGVGLSAAVVEAVRGMADNPDGNHRSRHCVPLGGTWGQARDGVGPHELAVMLARKMGAVAHSFPAPIVAGSAESAQIFIQEPAVAPALTMLHDADAIVVGIGAAPGAEGTLLTNLVSSADMQEATRAGAVGDIAARFFDDDGRAVASALDHRVVGLSLEDLRRVPTRIAIAYGKSKYRPLAAALSAGLINNLVTDVQTARHLLGDPTKKRTVQKEDVHD